MKLFFSGNKQIPYDTSDDVPISDDTKKPRPIPSYHETAKIVGNHKTKPPKK